MLYSYTEYVRYVTIRSLQQSLESRRAASIDYHNHCNEPKIYEIEL